MKNDLNLTQMRKQIYLSFSEDGLIDLAIGSIIFGFGALLLTGQPWMVSLLGIFPLLILLLGKQFITMPRTGSITMGTSMRKEFRISTVAVIFLGIGVFIFLFTTMILKPELSAEFPLVTLGIFFGIGIAATGLLVKSSRIIIYAALVILIITANAFLGFSLGNIDSFLLSTLVSGGLIILSGILVLVKFMWKYPVVMMEE